MIDSTAPTIIGSSLRFGTACGTSRLPFLRSFLENEKLSYLHYDHPINMDW
jgi:hypothetical protein